MLSLLLFVGGLAALTGGADLLVRGASRAALRLGIRPLVVGLTVVAFGTSAPEVAISLLSAVRGESTLALGNVVGSNTFNVLVVLGGAALVAPVVVAQKLVRFDVPILVGASIGVTLLGLDGRLGTLDGLLLGAGLLGYLALLFAGSRSTAPDVSAEYDRQFGRAGAPPTSWAVSGGLILGGLALLVGGSQMLVEGAVAIARSIGVSDLIIGLTIVAGGTSMPELATSLVAALRGERDIAAGNAIGSCLFNLLLVLGVTAVVAPGGVEVPTEALRFDLPVMVATAIACLPVFFSGNQISRWEGAVFLAYYAAYATYLVLDAADHDALPAYSGVMLLFVLPLTVLTLGVVGYRDLAERRRRRSGS